MLSPTAGFIIDCHQPSNGLLCLWRLLSAALFLDCNSGPLTFHHCYWFLTHIILNDLFPFFSFFPLNSLIINPPTEYSSLSCAWIRASNCLLSFTSEIPANNAEKYVYPLLWQHCIVDSLESTMLILSCSFSTQTDTLGYLFLSYLLFLVIYMYVFLLE